MNSLFDLWLFLDYLICLLFDLGNRAGRERAVEEEMGFNFGAELVRLGIVATTSDHKSVVSINLFVALLCACIVIGHLLEENRWMNESITALAIVSSSSPLEKDRFFLFFSQTIW